MWVGYPNRFRDGGAVEMRIRFGVVQAGKYTDSRVFRWASTYHTEAAGLVMLFRWSVTVWLAGSGTTEVNTFDPEPIPGLIQRIPRVIAASTGLSAVNAPV